MKAASTNDIETLGKVAEDRLVENTSKALKEFTLETNSPKILTCQVKELLRAESFIVPKGLKMRGQPTKVFRLPLSTQLIHRNLVTAKGQILGGYLKGYSRFARLHVVLMTNLKLIGKSQGDTIFGDYVKDGQFQEIIVVYESDFK